MEMITILCLLHSFIIDLIIIIIIIITITIIIITFRYHESVKDSDVVLSPWDTMSPTLGSTREMKFFKPVNLPGLASTRGVKLQRYKHFEDIGLILYSSTRLEDVPAADTFSVEDVLIVSVCIDILVTDYTLCILIIVIIIIAIIIITHHIDQASGCQLSER